MTTDNEAFEKWAIDTGNYTEEQYYHQGSQVRYKFDQKQIEAWQAAKADSTQEIEWLQAIKKTLFESQERFGKVILELQAHINVMREDLEKINVEVTGDAFGRWDTTERTTIKRHIIADICGRVLAQTPAQSLQAFGNDVIERCAKVCEKFGERDQFSKVTASAYAHKIRALKTDGGE